MVFTLLKTDFKELAFHGGFRFQYLALAVALGFVPWFINAIRLLRWTRFFKKPISFSRALHIAIGTELGSAATPTVMGGGYLKLGMLVQDGYSSGSAASLMVLGSIEDGLFMAAAVPASVWLCGGIRGVGLGSMMDLHSLESIWLIPVVAAAAVVSAVYLIRSHQRRKNETRWKRFQDWKKRFVSDFRLVTGLACGKGGGILAVNVLLTGIQWICHYQVVTAFMIFLGVQTDPVRFFLYQWIIFTVGTFVATPGGIGGIEAAFYLLFRPVVPGNLLALSMFGWRTLTGYLQLIIGAVVFIIMNRGYQGTAKPVENPLSDINSIASAELTA
jgi:uncharacterized protein (TIRG00374 family)